MPSRVPISIDVAAGGRTGACGPQIGGGRIEFHINRHDPLFVPQTLEHQT